MIPPRKEAFSGAEYLDRPPPLLTIGTLVARRLTANPQPATSGGMQ
jgi:hypothetical protein